MAKVKIQGHASGTGILTVTAPNTNTDRTITLPDGDVTLGAATPSIDDNGNATAITIDSDENVLIGKTTYVGGSGVTGIDIRPAGMVNIAREGDTLMYMNRKTSDGDIVEFRKDGTTKGSIGVTSSGAYITLGGTGAANTLDDYEEGTHTMSWTTGNSGSITMNRAAVSYTKIGRVVTIVGEVDVDSVSSPVGGVRVSLPFVIADSTVARNNSFTTRPGMYHVPHHQDNPPYFIGHANTSIIEGIYEQDNAAFVDWNPQAGEACWFSFSYMTT